MQALRNVFCSNKFEFYFQPITLFIILLLFSAKANAQGISYGAEIGVSASKVISVNSKQSWDPEFNTLPNAMIFAQDQLSEFISIKTGIRFFQMRSSRETTIWYVTDFLSSYLEKFETNKTLILNYVSIPIRFYIDLYDSGLFLYFGAELGYLISSSYKLDATPPQPPSPLLSPSYENEINCNFSKTNALLSSGIGYKFNDSRFYIAVQYLYGLSHISDDEFTVLRTTDLSLLVGYYF